MGVFGETWIENEVFRVLCVKIECGPSEKKFFKREMFRDKSEETREHFLLVNLHFVLKQHCRDFLSKYRDLRCLGSVLIL